MISLPFVQGHWGWNAAGWLVYRCSILCPWSCSDCLLWIQKHWHGFLCSCSFRNTRSLRIMSAGVCFVQLACKRGSHLLQGGRDKLYLLRNLLRIDRTSINANQRELSNLGKFTSNANANELKWNNFHKEANKELGRKKTSIDVQ